MGIKRSLFLSFFDFFDFAVKFRLTDRVQQADGCYTKVYEKSPPRRLARG
jgi:hypothetical protein